MKKKLYLFLTALFLLVMGTNLSARGAVEAKGVDSETLENRFELWLDQMEEGNMTGEEVMAQVREYQRSRNRINEEVLKEYQFCVNQLEEGDMTRDQIRDRLRDKDLLQTQDKLQTQDRDQLKEQDQDGDSDQLQTRDQTGKVDEPPAGGSGKSGNGQSGKK